MGYEPSTPAQERPPLPFRRLWRPRQSQTRDLHGPTQERECDAGTEKPNLTAGRMTRSESPAEEE